MSTIERLYGIRGAEHLLDTRVMAIVRGIPQQFGSELADALFRGGIRVMEITMNTAGAADMIQGLKSRFEDAMWIGAGTVLTLDDCESALDAGAQFFVTPNIDTDVIQFAVEHSLPIFPGAMTATEIFQAYRAGASAVKVFPSRSLGSGYIKDLRGPFPHIPMMAVGGVSASNAAEFLRAGATAVGVGGSLVNQTAILAGEFNEIERAARELIETVQEEAR